MPMVCAGRAGTVAAWPEQGSLAGPNPPSTAPDDGDDDASDATVTITGNHELMRHTSSLSRLSRPPATSKPSAPALAAPRPLSCPHQHAYNQTGIFNAFTLFYVVYKSNQGVLSCSQTGKIAADVATVHDQVLGKKTAGSGCYTTACPPRYTP